MFEQPRRQPFQHRQGGLDGGISDGTDIDVHKIPRLTRLVAQPGTVAVAAAGVQGHATAGAGVGGEGRQDFGLHALAGQGADHALDLPGR